MKRNLGKILFILFYTLNLFGAKVGIELSSPAVYAGDSVTFTLNATGSDVEFPEITDVQGYRIQSTSSSTSINMINGNYTKQISKSYSFSPKKDLTIPSFKIKVDGNILTTDPKQVSVIKPQASKNGDPFIVEMQVDKSELKVGESTTLKVIFKQRLDARANKLKLDDPKIENFWVKKIDNQKQYSQGQYVITEYSYLIFAQKAGEFRVAPLEANIGHVNRRASRMGGFFNDPFFNQMTNQLTWQKIYSNSLSLKVDKLPDNIELYGDFHIHASVDKREIYANKPLNLTIKIEGSGNIDDIKKFDINLPDAIVYPDKPEIDSHLKNGEYEGTFTQKIAIISDKDFTIPSLELKYFDRETKSVKTIQTEPIDVKVRGGATAQTQSTPVVQTLHPQKETNSEKPQTEVVVKQSKEQNYLFLLIGLILGSATTYFLLQFKKREKKAKESDIIKLIKNTNDDKKLFDILLPYSNDAKEIADILKQLEENIYKKANHKIDKQKLYDIFL